MFERRALVTKQVSMAAPRRASSGGAGNEGDRGGGDLSLAHGFIHAIQD